MNLYEKLVEYNKDDYYPMHMPGHKRNVSMMQMINPYIIDITEIDGFDNLMQPDDILLEGMKRTAKLYHSNYSHYLVGGSTIGILAGIGACTKRGDKILVARNSHKSVYHAIELNELEPIYIYPQTYQQFGINGGLNSKEIEELLITYSDIKLIVITSPTYEGIISDIKGIKKVACQYNIPVLVDEAHGAHLGFHPDFPSGAIKSGADIVIQSLHKTLPSFTQTALIHVNGNLINKDIVKRYINMYQTSSPSYLFMAGIDSCITLLEKKKTELFCDFSNKLNEFYLRMKQLERIRILTKSEVKAAGFYDFDPSKLIVSVKNTNMSGNNLYNILLDQYKIQMEMVSKDYVLGMTSICDTEEGFKRLGDALLEIDSNLMEKEANTDMDSYEKYAHNERTLNVTNNCTEYPENVMPSHHATRAQCEYVKLTESKGKIVADYINLYPPGIPILVPGERINEKLIKSMLLYKKNGLTIHGLLEKDDVYIKVISD